MGWELLSLHADSATVASAKYFKCRRRLLHMHHVLRLSRLRFLSPATVQCGIQYDLWWFLNKTSNSSSCGSPTICFLRKFFPGKKCTDKSRKHQRFLL